MAIAVALALGAALALAIAAALGVAVAVALPLAVPIALKHRHALKCTQPVMVKHFCGGKSTGMLRQHCLCALHRMSVFECYCYC